MFGSGRLVPLTHPPGIWAPSGLAGWLLAWLGLLYRGCKYDKYSELSVQFRAT